MKGSVWNVVASGTLPDARYRYCSDIPIVSIEGPFEVKFIKFTALNYYGIGAGLQYLNFTIVS